VAKLKNCILRKHCLQVYIYIQQTNQIPFHGIVLA